MSRNTHPEHSSEEPIAVISAEDWEAAQRDPKVHEFWRKADEYAESLIARGHCRCHLLVNCPDKERSS